MSGLRIADLSSSELSLPRVSSQLLDISEQLRELKAALLASATRHPASQGARFRELLRDDCSAILSPSEWEHAELVRKECGKALERLRSRDLESGAKYCASAIRLQRNVHRGSLAREVMRSYLDGCTAYYSCLRGDISHVLSRLSRAAACDTELEGRGMPSLYIHRIQLTNNWARALHQHGMLAESAHLSAELLLYLLCGKGSPLLGGPSRQELLFAMDPELKAVLSIQVAVDLIDALVKGDSIFRSNTGRELQRILPDIWCEEAPWYQSLRALVVGMAHGETPA